MKTVLSRKAVLAQGAVMTFLAPKLAQDAKIDLTPAFKGVSGKNFKSQKSAMVAGIKTATTGKLAQDADIEDVAKLLDALEEVEVTEGLDSDPSTGLPMAELKEEALDAEPMDKIKDAIKAHFGDRLTGEDIAKLDEIIGATEAMDETDEGKAAALKAAEDDKDEMVAKPAMDAAIKAAVKQATAQAAKTQAAIRDAERAVRPYVGDLAMAHDSAEAVYATALTTLGVKGVADIHPSAYPTLLAAQPVPGVARREKVIAMDATSVDGFNKRFPGAQRIGNV